MTDATDAPYSFATDRRFGQRDPVWGLPKTYAASPPSVQDRLRAALCGAVVQSEYARALDHLLYGPRRAHRGVTGLARAWDADGRWLGKVLRGDAVMRAADVALAVRVAGAAAAAGGGDRLLELPQSADLHLALRRALLGVPRPPSRPAPVRADPDGPDDDDLAVMNALTGGGFTIIERAATPEEEAGRARNHALAPGPALRAAARLIAHPSREAARPVDDPPPYCPPAGEPIDPDEHVVVLDAFLDSPPRATGGTHPAGFDLTVSLSPDWAAAVHDAGLAVTDGWFVLEVLRRHQDGTPAAARVLDLVPVTGQAGRDTDGQPLDDWEFLDRTAHIEAESDGRLAVSFPDPAPAPGRPRLAGTR